MEVSNKKYSQMARDYKKADKIYSEVKKLSSHEKREEKMMKSNHYGFGSQKMDRSDYSCPQPSEKQHYDYMKGVKMGMSGQDPVAHRMKHRKGSL